MENIPFLIARRRNQQRIHGSKWLSDIEDLLRIPPGSAQLVSPEDSIPRERQLQTVLRQGSVAGTVSRTTGLSLCKATEIWDSTLADTSLQLVVCNLLRHPDFVFTVPRPCLLGKLARLLEFDGDTVGVTSLDLMNGIVVDMYLETETARYEVDRWGEWSSQ